LEGVVVQVLPQLLLPFHPLLPLLPDLLDRQYSNQRILLAGQMVLAVNLEEIRVRCERVERGERERREREKEVGGGRRNFIPPKVMMSQLVVNMCESIGRDGERE
jgi:hypothetical protein